ncbi:hypothetical protein RHS01_03559 [Rhizoctonia solani]|uniref:Uncharacterized protein n=1 Tax=Rhizoctonia solani TaxID=456999 RepID=A0A8H7IGW0_9AGAM|nr:hypothetical protein RHS01_03559 [Rhizoctonia solani]
MSADAQVPTKYDEDVYLIVVPDPGKSQGIDIDPIEYADKNRTDTHLFWIKIDDGGDIIGRTDQYHNPSQRIGAIKISNRPPFRINNKIAGPGKHLEHELLQHHEMGGMLPGGSSEWHALYGDNRLAESLNKELRSLVDQGILYPLALNGGRRDKSTATNPTESGKNKNRPRRKKTPSISIVVTPSPHARAFNHGFQIGKGIYQYWVKIDTHHTQNETVYPLITSTYQTELPDFGYNSYFLTKRDIPNNSSVKAAHLAECESRLKYLRTGLGTWGIMSMPTNQEKGTWFSVDLDTSLLNQNKVQGAKRFLRMFVAKFHLEQQEFKERLGQLTKPEDEENDKDKSNKDTSGNNEDSDDFASDASGEDGDGNDGPRETKKHKEYSNKMNKGGKYDNEQYEGASESGPKRGQALSGMYSLGGTTKSKMGVKAAQLGTNRGLSSSNAYRDGRSKKQEIAYKAIQRHRSREMSLEDSGIRKEEDSDARGVGSDKVQMKGQFFYENLGYSRSAMEGMEVVHITTDAIATSRNIEGPSEHTAGLQTSFQGVDKLEQEKGKDGERVENKRQSKKKGKQRGHDTSTPDLHFNIYRNLPTQSRTDLTDYHNVYDQYRSDEALSNPTRGDKRTKKGRFTTKPLKEEDPDGTRADRELSNDKYRSAPSKYLNVEHSRGRKSSQGSRVP